MRERHWWFLVILLSAVITTTWLTFSIGHNTPLKAKTDDAVIDAFATEVHLTNLDETGQVSTQVYTPALMHYSKSNHTQLTSPALTVYIKKQPPWHITSHTGVLNNKTEEVNLLDHVNLHQDEGPTNEEVTIQTEALTVYPDKKTAMTNSPITLSSHSTHISAVGLHANLTAGTLELKTNARGQYEIPAG